MRQHVNPLSRFFQLHRSLLTPDELFENGALPIHLDIGCARGQFLLQTASLHDNWNHLGLEIRHPLVITAEKEREHLGLNNIHFLFCNANVSLQEWLINLPLDVLQRVSIQFPDPWFKRKHRKRRLLQPELLLSLASSLQAGRELFVQSDLLEVIEPMVYLIELSGCFTRKSCGDSWLNDNPWDVPTERESYVLKQGLPVYRMLYERNHMLTPELNHFEKICSQENKV